MGKVDFVCFSSNPSAPDLLLKLVRSGKQNDELWGTHLILSPFPSPSASLMSPALYLFRGRMLFIYFLFLAVLGLPSCLDFSLVVTSRGYSLLQFPASYFGGFSCWGAQALGHTYSVVSACRPQNVSSVVVVLGLSCSAACGIFPDQGLNPCPLPWQVDS